MLNIMSSLYKEYNYEEKEELRNLINNIVNLSILSNNEGLLRLYDYYNNLQPFLLRKGIEIILEGCYSKDLRFIIDNYIHTRQNSHKQLLDSLIIREGLLMIQEGEKSRILFEKILSMLGEGFFDDFDYSIFEKEEDLDKSPPRKFSVLEGYELFKARIMKIVDYKDMEKLIFRVGYYNMALALKGSSIEVERHVRNLISVKFVLHELDFIMHKLESYNHQDIINAQEFIAKAI